MSVIPSAPGHVAKASTCSDSVSTHGSTESFSSTTSGGCSSGGATSQNNSTPSWRQQV